MPQISRFDRALASPRRRGLLVAAAAAALLTIPVARADNIPVNAASLRIEEGDVLLSAEFGLSLTPALEQALDKGVPLYFTIEFELVRTRFLWFPEKIAQW